MANKHLCGKCKFGFVMDVAIDKELWNEHSETEKWGEAPPEGDQVQKTFTYCGHSAMLKKEAGEPQGSGRRPMLPYSVLKCDGYLPRS